MNCGADETPEKRAGRLVVTRPVPCAASERDRHVDSAVAVDLSELGDVPEVAHRLLAGPLGAGAVPLDVAEPFASGRSPSPRRTP